MKSKVLTHRWYASESGIQTYNNKVYTCKIVNKIGKIICKVYGSNKIECADLARHIIELHNKTL